MDRTLRISLVIATYNRDASLMRTLASVAEQDLPATEWEVVVVNNNCTDDTATLFAKFRGAHPELNFRMVSESRQGLSPARNRGIIESYGEYIAVIDDDQLINKGFLRAYIEFFDSRPDAAGAGGPITPIYETTPPAWMTRYTERPIAGTVDLGNKIKEFPPGKYPGGGNMAVRRSAIDRYGAFDPRLGRTGTALLGGEEKELFKRLRAAGQKIWYVPEAVVYHIIPDEKLTSSYLMRLSRMVGVSEYRRTRNAAGYVLRLIGEAVKWGATLALFFFYALTLRPLKGWYLVRMRHQITFGLLKGK